MTERADAIAGQPVTQRAWKNLAAHYKNIREVHLRQLFEDDPKRGEHLSAEAVGMSGASAAPMIAVTRLVGSTAME